MYFKRYSKVSGGKQLLRLRNQIVNKIIPKLDFTAQLMSTQKAITVPTFKVDVESVLSSHGYTFAVVSAPDWQLYQWCRDKKRRHSSNCRSFKWMCRVRKIMGRPGLLERPLVIDFAVLASLWLSSSSSSYVATAASVLQWQLNRATARVNNRWTQIADLLAASCADLVATKFVTGSLPRRRDYWSDPMPNDPKYLSRRPNPRIYRVFQIANSGAAAVYTLEQTYAKLCTTEPQCDAP